MSTVETSFQKLYIILFACTIYFIFRIICVCVCVCVLLCVCVVCVYV